MPSYGLTVGSVPGLQNLETFSNGASSLQSYSATYVNVLPSFNIRFELTPKQFVRFSASEGLSRPDMGNLRNYVGVTAPVVSTPYTSNSFNNVTFLAQAGNAAVRPMTAERVCSSRISLPRPLRAASSLRRDATGHDELIVLERAAQDRLDLVPQIRIDDLEYRGRAALALARSNQIRRRLPTQNQPQRRQEQAFPSPGLARPGAVSSLEFDMNVLDERQVLYRKFTKHRDSVSHTGRSNVVSILA